MDALVPLVILTIAALPCLVLGALNLYQAVTGNRVSKKPSTRSDAVMRRQSAIAACVMFGCAAIVIALGVLIIVTGPATSS